MKSLFLALLLLPLAVTGCGGEKYGAGIDRTAAAVKVRDIFLQPGLLGTDVTVEGTISTQCQSNGCWFVLQDETGQIYVDLSSNNFSLPSRQGRTVRASGTVASNRSNLLLVARGVEVK